MRTCIFLQRCRLSLYLYRVTQLKNLENRMHIVTCHIAESACSEIPPSPEVPWVISSIVRAERHVSYPKIPVECFWRFLNVCWRIESLGPYRSCRPDIYFFNFSYFTGPGPRTSLSDTITRGTLVSHL